MAETTTAQAYPASPSRFTCAATLRMRSTSATDVPPNLSTNRDTRPSRAGALLTLPAYSNSMAGPGAGQKTVLHTDCGGLPQPGSPSLAILDSGLRPKVNGLWPRAPRQPRSTATRSLVLHVSPEIGGTSADPFASSTASTLCASPIYVTSSAKGSG